jgi:pimeloyl-ACP methyl ester carboxylesterase
VYAGLQDHLLVVIYLHGFASSSHSGKAIYLGERLRARGVEFQAPDLNLPDFSTLTITRMLEQTRGLIDAATEPVTLIGSSLGAFVGVNAAAKWPGQVAKLVLLAPALDFGPSTDSGPSPAQSRDGDEGRKGPGGADLGVWKKEGRLNVFHFGYGRILPVHYELYEDARRYDAVNAALSMPILIFQGRRDTAVDPAAVEAWAARRSNVELHMLDDEHQLTSSLSYIWEKLAAFLNLAAQGSKRPTDSR